jgi:hypothetical protein
MFVGSQFEAPNLRLPYVIGYVLKVQPEHTKYIAVCPMTLNCPRCAATPGQICEILNGELELVHIERIEAAAAMDVAARTRK